MIVKWNLHIQRHYLFVLDSVTPNWRVCGESSPRRILLVNLLWHGCWKEDLFILFYYLFHFLSRPVPEELWYRMLG